MTQNHLRALQKKHEDLEKRIHEETVHAAKDEQAIRRLKEQKLHVKEEIEKLKEATY